jgi:hypothetical protein
MVRRGSLARPKTSIALARRGAYKSRRNLPLAHRRLRYRRAEKRYGPCSISWAAWRNFFGAKEQECNSRGCRYSASSSSDARCGAKNSRGPDHSASIRPRQREQQGVHCAGRIDDPPGQVSIQGGVHHAEPLHGGLFSGVAGSRVRQFVILGAGLDTFAFRQPCRY